MADGVESTEPRLAEQADAGAIATTWLRSRHASAPAYPLPVHPDDECRQWLTTVVLPHRETWVIDGAGADAVDAMLVLGPAEIDHLHVAPGRTGRGLGSRLVELAKERQPDGVTLWTFQSNLGARRFYERHGFGAIAFTDGDNDEGEPDVQYRWPSPG